MYYLHNIKLTQVRNREGKEREKKWKEKEEKQ